jgi:hypothetical protein
MALASSARVRPAVPVEQFYLHPRPERFHYRVSVSSRHTPQQERGNGECPVSR